MQRLARWLATALLLGNSAVARAEDAPKPPPPAPAPATPKILIVAEIVNEVLASVRAKDDGALKALAAKDLPDPWMVADELIHRGELDAAEAFAKAAPRVDVERLADYVASRRGK